MSEHKTALSNWTEEEKALYSERRSRTVETEKRGGRKHQKRLTGQLSYVNMHLHVKDEEGNDQLVPLGYRKPRSGGH